MLSLPGESVADVPSQAYACRDAHLFRVSRPNVLLIGSDDDLDAAITAIVGRPAISVPAWPDDPLSTPASGDDATVIVKNVMRLDPVDQHRLNRWLDEGGSGIRVIATTPEPVYPMVEARLFLEALYYRLNVVCVDAGGLERVGRLA